MQVQQQVGFVDDRAHFARPVQLQGAAHAEQLGIVPDPVQILFDEARGERVGRVEAGESLDIGEAHGQPPTQRHEILPQQFRDDDGPGELVAVHQGHQHHMRAGPAGIACGEAAYAGVAR